jgi:4-hydroxyphenylpyruvate dioxygenase
MATTTPQTLADRLRPAQDPFPIQAFDYVEFWCGNARQSAAFYREAFGLAEIAYAGPETGVRDRASYVLGAGDFRIVLTSGLRPDDEFARLLARHGDFVRTVAFRVPDADAAFKAATERGAEGVAGPLTEEDATGRIRTASIRTYGDTIHELIDRSAYTGAWRPGYEALPGAQDIPKNGILNIDHVVGNVELGKMDEWVGYYEKVMGMAELRHFTDDQISTEYSSLMSKVVWDGEGIIKLPINEPATSSKRKSQIDEYLEFNGGPGVQHIALAVDDIVATVERMRAQGLRFMDTPDTYYDDLRERVGEVDADYGDLQRLKILADRDEEGYLLQIFTQNVQDRPTVFFELIERHGSRGFGEGNFKALFVSIEREQARRGNL